MFWTHRKIDAGYAVHNHEYILLCEFIETVVHAHWEHDDEQVEIKIEGGPGCRLVFWHWGYDWDVVLGIGGVQERVESAGPRGDLEPKKKQLIFKKKFYPIYSSNPYPIQHVGKN